MINMEAIPKFNIKSVIKSDIRIKPTTWIGHYCLIYILFLWLSCYDMYDSLLICHSFDDGCLRNAKWTRKD